MRPQSCFRIAVVFIVLTLLLQAFSTSANFRSRTGCEISQSRPSIQSAFADLGSLLSCPTGPGFVPLSNVYPPTGIFVGYTPQTEKFIQQLAEAIGRFPDPPQINVIVEAPQLQEAKQRLTHLLKGPLPTFVRLLSSQQENVFWIQDAMEFGSHAGKSAILDLPNYYNDGPEDLPEELSQQCGIEFIPQLETFDDEPDGSEVGGNIESYPGGVLAVGRNLDPELLRYLKGETNQRVVTLDTDWLSTGHVDELFTVVPSKKEPCGFAVLHASPALGLELLKEIRQETRTAPLEPEFPGRKITPSRTPGAPRGCMKDLPRAQLSRPLTVSEALACSEFIAMNSNLELRIQADLALLIGAIADRTGCHEVRTIPLPLLFVPDPLDNEKAEALNPNLINGLVLNQVIIQPKQPHPFFERAATRLLREIGVEAIFTDGSVFHFLGGGIHCGTHALRACNELASPN